MALKDWYVYHRGLYHTEWVKHKAGKIHKVVEIQKVLREPHRYLWYSAHRTGYSTPSSFIIKETPRKADAIKSAKAYMRRH